MTLWSRGGTGGPGGERVVVAQPARREGGSGGRRGQHSVAETSEKGKNEMLPSLAEIRLALACWARLGPPRPLHDRRMLQLAVLGVKIGDACNCQTSKSRLHRPGHGAPSAVPSAQWSSGPRAALVGGDHCRVGAKDVKDPLFQRPGMSAAACWLRCHAAPIPSRLRSNYLVSLTGKQMGMSSYLSVIFSE